MERANGLQGTTEGTLPQITILDREIVPASVISIENRISNCMLVFD
jgi:hypothetical protein